LTQLVAGKTGDWKNVIFSERTGIFVRSGKYKLIQNDPVINVQYELYDLSANPHETKNLINDTELKSVFDDLKQKLEAWQNENPDVPKYPGLEPKFAPGIREPVTNNQRRERRGNR
jgi:arylsulfatase A-like enzyme